MADEALVKHALELLRADPEHLQDARKGAPVGNSIIGSVMSITLKRPRQYTEEAVREALKRLDSA
jgi:hypothetical protein